MAGISPLMIPTTEKCVKKRKNASEAALNLREVHPIMYTTAWPWGSKGGTSGKTRNTYVPLPQQV
jgi:hypothetical protein